MFTRILFTSCPSLVLSKEDLGCSTDPSSFRQLARLMTPALGTVRVMHSVRFGSLVDTNLPAVTSNFVFVNGEG